MSTVKDCAVFGERITTEYSILQRQYESINRIVSFIMNSDSGHTVGMLNY